MRDEKNTSMPGRPQNSGESAEYLLNLLLVVLSDPTIAWHRSWLIEAWKTSLVPTVNKVSTHGANSKQDGTGPLQVQLLLNFELVWFY